MSAVGQMPLVTDSMTRQRRDERFVAIKQEVITTAGDPQQSQFLVYVFRRIEQRLEYIQIGDTLAEWRGTP